MSQKNLFVIWPTFDELMTLLTNILLPHLSEKYLADCRQTSYLALMYYSPDLSRSFQSQKTLSNLQINLKTRSGRPRDRR